MEKEKNKRIIILVSTISIMLLILLCAVIYVLYVNKDLEKGMEESGYTTEDDSYFYEKIETNNTIDDYYNDVKNDKNSEFTKYYVSKEMDNFIELKLINDNNVKATLNIVNNLKTGKTTYNYEVKYQNSHLIFEGDSDNNYECNFIVKKNVKKETMNYYCNQIEEEINSFNYKKQELLSNERVQKRIN